MCRPLPSSGFSRFMFLFRRIFHYIFSPTLDCGLHRAAAPRSSRYCSGAAAPRRRNKLRSLPEDSPVHSSSSDDFVAILDAELDAASDSSDDSEAVAEEEESSEEDDDDRSDYLELGRAHEPQTKSEMENERKRTMEVIQENNRRLQERNKVLIEGRFADFIELL
ncbi:uncharacterized protein LOC131022511 isoform X3 [Salvia miltiorrhiza]|uniref:uncharacterized protein LOC131022511 isoform X3 n=1 Tax=Salvia miltiorrhiza TaxID=226208 RepID=UPI0025ABA0CE|nr:uncharacterized protein LOC131022511 isoform X3 [Salvia miltiorrhiza]